MLGTDIAILIDEMESAFELYIKKISKMHGINKEDEKRMFFELRAGKESVRGALITSNLRLVIKIAKAYSNNHDLLIELIQEGNLGLMIAVDRYDPARGFTFSTYATWWIKHHILKWLMTRFEDVKIPERLKIKIAKVRKRILNSSEHLQIEEALMREDIVGKPAKEVLYSYGRQNCVKLTDDIHSGTPIEDELISKTFTNELKIILQKLTFRDRLIIMYKYGFVDGESRSLSQLGKMFGLTPEGVRQIVRRVFRLIEKESMHIKEYRA